MDVVALIGRILFVALFFFAGAGHLTAPAFVEYARSKKVPFARLSVLATGVWIILGAASVLLGVWADLGALMLTAFVISTAVIMHNFWTETDSQAQQMEMTQFMKDLALAGAGLLIFVLYGKFDPGLTITGPLFF